MLLNGTVRPVMVAVEHVGRKQTRYQMQYQAPAEKPVTLCGIQVPGTYSKEPPPLVCNAKMHVSALQARQCATAKAWNKILMTFGYAALEELRELATRTEAERAAIKAAEAHARELRG